MDISPINYKGKILSGERSETLKQDKEHKATFREITKVEVLDYLGGGKLIIDVKGQRIVATSDILIEKGQEIYVRVINIGEEKIILQLIPNELLTPKLESNEHENLPIGNIMKDLLMLIESFKNSIIDSDKENLVLQIANLLRNIPIKFNIETDFESEKIAEQILKSIIMSGYNYEYNLAKSVAKRYALLDYEKPILKAELLKLMFLLQDEPQVEDNKKELLKDSVENLLKNIEYLQLKSALSGKIYIDLPIVMDGQETTAELEFFQNKSKQDEDKNINISIRFNLETIGYIEFIMNIVNKDISCQIKASKQDTYIKLKSQLDILEKSFTSLGYNIIGIFCSQNTRKIYSLDTKC